MRSSAQRRLNSEAWFRGGEVSTLRVEHPFYSVDYFRLPLHTAVFHFTKGPDFRGVGQTVQMRAVAFWLSPTVL